MGVSDAVRQQISFLALADVVTDELRGWMRLDGAVRGERPWDLELPEARARRYALVSLLSFPACRVLGRLLVSRREPLGVRP